MGQENPQEEEMETHSSILAWRIHGKRSLEGYSPWVCKESYMTWQLSTHECKGKKRKKLHIVITSIK